MGISGDGILPKVHSLPVVIASHVEGSTGLERSHVHTEATREHEGL